MTNLKILITLTLLLFFVACSTDADDEYVFDAAVVCPDNARGTFVDERDGQTYKYTTIGDRKWMAQNLNFVADSGSGCRYKEGCAEKGRVYRMDVLKSVCPSGWHSLTNDDWNDLFELMGGDSIAAFRLKSVDGWAKLNRDDGPSGSDDCGFSIVPAITSSTLDGEDLLIAAFWSSPPNQPMFWSYKDGVTMGTAPDFYYHSVRCVEDR